MKKRVTSRDLQADQTRRRIIDAAIRLFRTRNYDEISMTDIANEAKVSTGALYHHFNAKYDLAICFCEVSDDALLQKWENAFHANRHAADLLMAFFAGFYVESIHAIGVDVSSVYLDPTNHGVKLDTRYYETLEDIIARGQARGELKTEPEPAVLSDFLSVAARGAAADWCRHNGDYDLQARMRAYMEILIGSFVADDFRF